MNRDIVITSKEHPHFKVIMKAPNIRTSIGVFMDTIRSVKPEKLNASMVKYDIEGNMLLEVPNIIRVKKMEVSESEPVKTVEKIVKNETFKTRKPFESLSESYKKQLLRKREKIEGVYMDRRKNNPGRPRKIVVNTP
jgi:hypothetical protein